ncbi:GvpL/GvpF family gas vesicle protein [Streptomyces sp. NPDC005803]|uniref:GvpL/GvpF family gas vesicle protein n=1 Tax=Streptomyces sp. NPDC005803 TaxID=3154297 RepID=UPI00340E5BE2
MPERGPGTSGAHAIYVYAVCRTEAPLALGTVPGVTRDEPVRTLPLGSLTAVVQTVAAAEFTDAAWQERLSDAVELERYARAHHAVVSAVAGQAPTVPLPLATLYQGDDRARSALNDEAGRFHTALKRIEHHAEWGVKVYAPPQPGGGGAAPPLRPSAPVDRTRPAPGAGRAYLDRKRNQRAQREQRQEDSLRIADAVDADVSRIATASRRLRPHGQGSAGGPRVQVLNATYLVAEHRSGELQALAAGLRERTGAEIEVSGPWVPYSFVGEV